MDLYDGYGWIKVPRYRDDPAKSWEERYLALEEHHVAETMFLIEKVRELARRVADLEQPRDLKGPGAGDA